MKISKIYYEANVEISNSMLLFVLIQKINNHLCELKKVVFSFLQLLLNNVNQRKRKVNLWNEFK